jgi:hypothetical protein
MPTFTESHIRVTVLGDAWASTEQWQFGVNCRHLSGVPPTNAGLQALADGLATPTNSFFSQSVMKISPGARLTGIKAALVDTTGHYPATSIPGIYTYPTPITGTATTNGIPQATLACTLISDIPRGRASKGRFYMPPISPNLGADGRMLATDVDQIEGYAKIWLNAIIADANVVAILVMSGLGAGTTGVVTSIGVGRVVDTMRSRRRSLLEARTPLTL